MDTPERTVTIYGVELLGFDEEAQQAEVLVCSSKGTYIRTLAHDAGARLGVGAYAASLRRTRVGALHVTEAVPPAAVAAGLDEGGSPAILSLAAALSTLPRYDVHGREETLARNGNKLQGLPAGRVAVWGSGRLLGVYEGVGGVSSPLVVFVDPQE